jgi:hypothetical protein
MIYYRNIISKYKTIKKSCCRAGIKNFKSYKIRIASSSEYTLYSICTSISYTRPVFYLLDYYYNGEMTFNSQSYSIRLTYLVIKGILE